MLVRVNGNKSFSVHKLIALAFLPNPNNYLEINHKDEDKTNNRVENLEWCDHKYNSNYGTRSERIRNTLIRKKHCFKSVAQYTKEGKLVKVYQSVAEAQRLTKINNISACISMRCKYAGDYVWLVPSISFEKWKIIMDKKIKDKKRPVIQYTREGEYINTFDSVTEASKATSVNLGHICQCCLKKEKTAGGFVWKWKN